MTNTLLVVFTLVFIVGFGFFMSTFKDEAMQAQYAQQAAELAPAAGEVPAEPTEPEGPAWPERQQHIADLKSDIAKIQKMKRVTWKKVREERYPQSAGMSQEEYVKSLEQAVEWSEGLTDEEWNAWHAEVQAKSGSPVSEEDKKLMPQPALSPEPKAETTEKTAS